MTDQNYKDLTKVEKLLEGLTVTSPHDLYLLVSARLLLAKLGLSLAQAENRAITQKINRPQQGELE